MIIPILKYSRLAGLCLFLGAALAAHGAAPADGPNLDLQTRPAAIKAHAASSVFLSVATAGRRVVAVGEQGIVLLSDDLGVTWRQAQVPCSVALTKVQFLDARQGWAVGHAGTVLHSADGGATWVRQLDGLHAAQIELAAAQEALPHAGADGARRVRDAEQLVRDGADKPLLDVNFSDLQHGLVVGAYGLAFSTRDGGKTWESIREKLDNPGGRHLYGILVARENVYIAGEQGLLFHSTDAGQHFYTVTTPYAGSYFGIVGDGNDGVLLYGLRGNVYRSAGADSHWEKIDMGLPVTLTAGQRLASGEIVLVDETGRVMLSRDRGATFHALPANALSAFTGVVQLTDASLLLSSMHGMVRIPSDTVTGDLKK